jgi:predicted molibdopterin-dependent oxidoreductase YjgC
VFLPFHFGAEQTVNLVTNPALDPISRMPEFKACAVRLEQVQACVPVAACSRPGSLSRLCARWLTLRAEM